MILYTFAAQESTRYILVKAELNLHLTDGVLKTLRLSVMKNMTTKLSTRATDHTELTSAGQPDILIAVDHYWELISLGLTKTRYKFYMVLTKMCKVITGKQTIESNGNNVINNVIACYTLAGTVTQFWGLESMEIKEAPKSNDDDEALKAILLNPTIQRRSLCGKLAI